MPPQAPYLNYDALRRIAEDFLGNHHSSRLLPVPIEEIVEFQFKIDIIPMPGLHLNYDVDSFISSDLSEIRVDEYVYESRRSRYRFSLAHELSHRLIHSDVFHEYSFSSIDEWKEALKSIPEKEYRFLEWQASSLGGLILVPPPELADEYCQATVKVKAIGIEPTDPIAIDAMENGLAQVFDVSPAVIHKRSEFDKLNQ